MDEINEKMCILNTVPKSKQMTNIVPWVRLFLLHQKKLLFKSVCNDKYKSAGALCFISQTHGKFCLSPGRPSSKPVCSTDSASPSEEFHNENKQDTPGSYLWMHVFQR